MTFVLLNEGLEVIRNGTGQKNIKYYIIIQSKDDDIRVGTVLYREQHSGRITLSNAEKLNGMKKIGYVQKKIDDDTNCWKVLFL
jgi:hypothetical protein